MKVLVIYRPQSEFSRVVEEFIHDYRVRQTTKLEVIDIDSRDGSATASLYDVMQHPAILVTRDDGTLLRVWQGERMPLQNEVAAYAYS